MSGFKGDALPQLIDASQIHRGAVLIKRANPPDWVSRNTRKWSVARISDFIEKRSTAKIQKLQGQQLFRQQKKELRSSGAALPDIDAVEPEMDPALMHVAMSLGGDTLVESGGGGVSKSTFASAKFYEVFEYHDDDVAVEAARLMEAYTKTINWYSFHRLLMTNYAAAMKFSDDYGLLAKVRAWRMDKASFMAGWTGLICSESVILFYQVAARHLKLQQVPIAMDGNHTSPMMLARYFSEHGDAWRHAGTFSGGVGLPTL